MTEEEIGEDVIIHIKENYPDWKIGQEISTGYARPVADIALLNDKGEIWVIEIKTSLSLDLIRQAYNWDVDYRSVAVPDVSSKSARKIRRFWYGILRHELEIGTILVKDNYVTDYYDPPKHEVRYSGKRSEKEILTGIVESGIAKGYSKAGSESGGYWTPYKASIEKVKEYIEENPGATIKEIVNDLGKLHYSSEKSARSTLTQRLRTIEKDWCRRDREGWGAYEYYVKEEEND